MPVKFKVATFNVNSIRSRLSLVLDWLQSEGPDVFCLQETKVKDELFPASEIKEAGYFPYFRGKGGRAGVATLLRQNAQEVAYGLDDGEGADEDRLIMVKVMGISIVNTYIPQGQSVDSETFLYKLRWLKRLKDFFNRHFSPSLPLLWCGDFNVAPEEIDVHDPKALKNHVDFHPEVRKALSEIKEWGFVDVFRLHHPQEEGQFTFWDYRVPQAILRNVGWRVDHIWATRTLAEKSLRSWIDLDLRKRERPSDHTVLAAEFSL